MTIAPALPMDWVILNFVEQVEDESGMEITKCLLQLQATQVEDATSKIEELSETEQLMQFVVQKDLKLK